MKKVEKKMLKTKLSLALSTALLGVGMMGHVQAVPSLGEDGLGDAALFPYYSAQGGWQTFIRLINTSNEAMAVKVRFREQANSRDVLDFVVLLSPNDMWGAWTDGAAATDNHGTPDSPGIRTRDTSCLVPGVDTTPVDGESFVTLDSAKHLIGAAFKDASFSGAYDDNGTVHFTGGAKARLSEGHIEVIGIASYANGTDMSNWISHNPATGRPTNCHNAINAFVNAANGGNTVAISEADDAQNALAVNAYMINVGNGQGGGYDPTIIRDFKNSAGSGAELATQAANSSSPGAGRQPDLNSADVGVVDGSIVRAGELVQYWQGQTVAPTGIDTISTLLMRTSVINEWAAKKSSGVFSNKYTQWVVNFPTKGFYVDLDNDPNVAQDVSATLTDPTVGNDAVAPFDYEFDLGPVADANVAGKSCQRFHMDMWNTEEDHASFTSPVPFTGGELCQETNVVGFSSDFAGSGLATANPVTIDDKSFPVMPFLDRNGVANPKAQSGWGRLTFNTRVGSPNGLPVNGFMMTVFDKGSDAANYTTIHDHKYERSAQWFQDNGGRSGNGFND